MTFEEQLASVQSAIAAIESGAQEYQLLNRKVRRADLQTLYNREKDLMNRIALRDGELTAYAQWGQS